MSEIEVRPARTEDRDSVLEFCARTWEWGDYIERVWDDWLLNPDGCLFAATVDGRPVGIVNMRMLSKTEAWLEGLRVDPAYRQRGLARELNLAALAEAMRRGATVARLAVDAENTRSRRISEAGHMREVAAFALYQATPIAAEKRAPQDQTQLAAPQDLDEIIDYLNLSNTFPSVGGLYYVGFTAREISAELLAEKIADQQIYLLRRWDRIDGLAIAEPRIEWRQHRLSVGYIDGTTIEAISLIAYDLRRQITTLGLEAVRIYAPDLVLVRDGLSGVEYEWDGSVFYTYERSLV